MARKTRSKFQSASSRSVLEISKRPHWEPLTAGFSLGYRRCEGAGRWVLRSEAGGWEKTFARADDREPANGSTVLDYDQACACARKLAAGGQGDVAQPVTLDQALTAYAADLEARDANPYNAKLARYHLPASMLSKPLGVLSQRELTSWRDGMLKKALARGSINRIRNCLRAALELADPSRSATWKAGLPSVSNGTKADNAVLPDVDASPVIEAAYRYDLGLGLFSDVLGSTGTRPSQAARIPVKGLTFVGDKASLQIPNSAKGGGRNRADKKNDSTTVAIPRALAAKLQSAAAGRDGDAMLLLRSNGQEWPAHRVHGIYRRHWRRVVEGLGLDPDAYGMYSLRHTAITRMINANIPIRIIAKVCNTSVSQIERHYTAKIDQHADEVMRAGFGEAA